MDANEYALKVQPAEQSLGLVVRQAEWMQRRRPSRRRASVAEPERLQCRRLSLLLLKKEMLGPPEARSEPATPCRADEPPLQSEAPSELATLGRRDLSLAAPETPPVAKAAARARTR